MQITYIGAFDAVRLPDGTKVANGETVEVDDDLGASLCEQEENWTAADGAASKTAATKKARTPKAAEAAEAKEKP